MNTPTSLGGVALSRRRLLLAGMVSILVVLLLVGKPPPRALADDDAGRPWVAEVTRALLGLPDADTAPGPRRARLIDRRVFSPVTALVVTISATMTDALLVDSDSDNKADPGDKIRYTVQVENSGDMDAAGLAFSDVLDPNTTLVPGSENVSPLPFDDVYPFTVPVGNPFFQGNNLVVTTTASTLFEVTDAGQGLFANDVEFLGDAFFLHSFDAASALGGAVTVNANGTFSVDYTVPGAPAGADTFDYTLVDGAGLTGSATVTINPTVGTVVLTDGGVPITVTHIAGGATKRSAATGTFEDPFTMLPGTQGTDIVYVYSGSAFTGQGYAMNADQRLLGEGDNNAHVVHTDQLGPINLPNVNGAGNPRPVIDSAPGDAVQAGNNTEVSNFQLDNATLGGLFASGLTGTLDLNRTRIDGGDVGIDILGGTGTFNFTDVTITDPASACFRHDGGSVNMTFHSGSLTQNTGGATVLILGGHSGMDVFSGGTSINATNGPGLQFDSADGLYIIGGTTTLNGGDAGVDILGNSSGAFTFSVLTITNPTGTALNVEGGSAMIDFLGGSILQNNNALAVHVQGGHTGTLIFDPSVNVTATNGTGLLFNNADGLYDFGGGTTLNGGDAGIDILGNSSGTFTFSSVTAITNPTGIAFNVEDFDAPGQIDFNGSIVNNSDAIVEISTTAPGSSINFNNTGGNTLTSTNNPFAAISITGADGDVTMTTPTTIDGSTFSSLFGGVGSGIWSFTDLTILNQSDLNSGVDLAGQTGTVNFTDLIITTNTAGTGRGATGFIAGVGNIVNVFGNSTIDADGGPALCIVDLSTINMTFQRLTSTNNTFAQLGFCPGVGVELLIVGGGTFDVTGTTTVDNADHAALSIEDVGATVTFADVDFDNITGVGVFAGVAISNPGTVNINGGTIANVGNRGIFVGQPVTTVNSFNLNNTTFSNIGAFTADITNSTVSGSGNVAVPFSCFDGGGNTGQISFNGGADNCPGPAALPRVASDSDEVVQLQVAAQREMAERIEARKEAAQARRQEARERHAPPTARALAEAPPLHRAAPRRTLAPAVDVAPPARPASPVIERAGVAEAPAVRQSVVRAGGSQAFPIIIGTLPAGKGVTITFDASIRPVSCPLDFLSNQGSVSGDNFSSFSTDDPDDPASNADPTLTPADPSCVATDVTATKTDAVVVDHVGSPGADPGDTIEYTIRLANLGFPALDNVVYTDTVDPNTVLVCGSVTTTKGAVACTGGAGGSFTVTIGTVDATGGADDEVTITFRVTVSDPFPDDLFEVANQGEFVADNLPALLTDDPATSAPADATVTPVNAADVEIDKVLTAYEKTASVITATFTLTVFNNGPKTATGVIVDDLLPGVLTFTGAAFSDPTDTYSAGTGRWTVGTLAVGGSATLAIHVTAAAETFTVNVASVAAAQPDPRLDNNLAGERLGRTPPFRAFRADLSLAKSVDQEAPAAGALVTYTITVHNSGPHTTAGVEVTDLLPPGLDFVGAVFSDPTDGYDPASGRWLVGALRRDSSATLTLTTRVTGSGTIINMAEVSSSHLPDPDSRLGNAASLHEDDDASATITVQGAAPRQEAAPASASDAPTRFEVGPNYPNPFNPETVIPYAIPEALHVRIGVYDVLGREVAVLLDAPVTAGRHRVVWHAANQPTGVYLVRVQAGAVVQTQRISLVK